MIKMQKNVLWQILNSSLRIKGYIFNLCQTELNGYVAPRENKLTGIISVFIKSVRQYNFLAMSVFR